MENINETQIKEIAEFLECGLCVYIHKSTNEIISLPDFSINQNSDNEGWEDIIEKLEKNRKDYLEVEKPTSSDSFEIMEAFVYQLHENNLLKNRLIIALNRKKPFMHFNHEIHNSAEYRQEWFNFKNKKFKDWLIKKLSNENIN